jgi:hypothetical protein
MGTFYTVPEMHRNRGQSDLLIKLSKKQHGPTKTQRTHKEHLLELDTPSSTWLVDLWQTLCHNLERRAVRVFHSRRLNLCRATRKGKELAFLDVFNLTWGMLLF